MISKKIGRYDTRKKRDYRPTDISVDHYSLVHVIVCSCYFAFKGFGQFAQTQVNC